MTTFCNTSDTHFTYSIYKKGLAGSLQVVHPIYFIDSIQCNSHQECFVPDYVDVSFICPKNTICLDLCYLQLTHNLTLYLILLLIVIIILSAFIYYIDSIVHRKRL